MSSPATEEHQSAATCPQCGRLVALDSWGRFTPHSARKAKPGANSLRRINGGLAKRPRLKVCASSGKVCAPGLMLKDMAGLVHVLTALCVHANTTGAVDLQLLATVRGQMLEACVRWPELLDGSPFVVAMVDPGDSQADAARIL